jgi:hypothetical protein
MPAVGRMMRRDKRDRIALGGLVVAFGGCSSTCAFPVVVLQIE